MFKKPSLPAKPPTTNPPQQRVFSPTQLLNHLEKHNSGGHIRHDPRLPKLSVKEVIEHLIATGEVARHEFDTLFRCGPRYTWGNASVYEVLRSLRPKGYLSHHAAAHAHGLTPETPTVMYWNDEQTPKPRPETPPNQARIDTAFSRRPRTSNNSSTYKGQKICILSGMCTGRLGVIEQAMPDGLIGPVTDLERTLIDLAVRPAYGGGPNEVLVCYRRAAARVSTKRLKIMLGKLNYAYPYHQAVGFYLDRAGVPGAELLRAIPRQFDFYLAHQLKKPAYSREWQIYYPRDI